jgi:Na+/H+ antiporter NhaD/arsenite permease-like protein
MRVDLALSVAIAALAPSAALGAELDGGALGLPWALPFALLLACIAVLPLLAAHLWEQQQGWIIAGIGVLALLPLAMQFGSATAAAAVLHTALLDYLPFILLLVALFTVAGGIVMHGNLHGGPLVNSVLLVIGVVLASVIGTTGASMVMIRPVLRANDDRRHRAHIVIFFIFLVSNIGGSLTPLGDPPLFLGFLRGVDFFWSMQHLLLPMALTTVLVLAVFIAIDTALYRREGRVRPDPTPDSPVRVEGLVNTALIAVIIAAILWSAAVDLGTLSVAGIELELSDVMRDAVLVAVTIVSIAVTPAALRQANGFSWAPMQEVARLFAGIFVTLIPVLAMLRAGLDGALGPALALVLGPGGQPNDFAVFWLTGALSSFLDNAPTYLVFFELAGGDPGHLMSTGATTLAAISAGAVFMGANSYIGNAPNLMVYAIARQAKVGLPSFFGYLGWAAAVLLPVFLVVWMIFFR